MVDYLVVGLGLAGISFCEMLESQGKRFHVVDAGTGGASGVAGGIYNPVVLKRLNLAWGAGEQLPLVAPYYSRMEQKLKTRLHWPQKVLRRFSSAEEQNQWFQASDTRALQPFLSTTLVGSQNEALLAPFGYGEVLGTGRIETKALLQAYAAHLTDTGRLSREAFDHRQLKMESGRVTYKAIETEKVIFLEGMGLQQNPFFNYLPLQGNKGEYLKIHCPTLQETAIIKAGVFLIPEGADIYSVGATYDVKDAQPEPTERARVYLEQKLKGVLNCPYEVVGQVAGIRPTVPDRRPLLGQHPDFRQLYVFNGLGSRGVMMAPYLASCLYLFAEEGNALPPEIDIHRYGHLKNH
jgi:glycine/D-amino acid oxidase-like deaminating enzyme